MSKILLTPKRHPMPLLRRIAPAPNRCYGLLLLTAGFCLPAQAHVKWLYQPGLANMPDSAPFRFSEPAVGIWLIIIAFAMMVAAELSHSTESGSGWIRLQKFGCRHWNTVHRAIGILVGFSLLRCSLSGALIAPHLTGSGPAFDAFLVVQSCSAVLLLLGQAQCAAVAALLVVSTGVIFQYGLIPYLEYAVVPGLGAFFAVHDHKHWRLLRAQRLVALRVLLGISLITLALTEKLLDPQMAVELLAQQPLNFMQALGFDYSDRLFILSAGSVELIFGLCFLLGISVRLNVIGLCAFLIASNSYFLFTGNLDGALLEISGHAPLFAALLPLLLFGRGQFSVPRGIAGKHPATGWAQLRAGLLAPLYSAKSVANGIRSGLFNSIGA